MVNVGGRSKGCSNCRRRRIKCDESRPACMRCQKHGLSCDGPKDFTFLEGKIVKSRRSNKPAPRSAEGVITSNSNDARDPAKDSTPLITIPKINEQDVSVCYTRRLLFPNGPIDMELQGIQLGKEPSTDGELFRNVSLSMAYVLFGTQHGHGSMVNRGYAMHGKALQLLNQALSDPITCSSDDVLLSVGTFAIMEGLIPTRPRAYLEHMIGLERLFELRDPTTFLSYQSKKLLKHLRHMILFAALRSHRPSILAKPQWKAVLRTSCSEEELKELELYDILADCTVLNAACQKLASNVDKAKEGSSGQRLELRQRALNLLIGLQKWKVKWDRDPQNICSELPVQPTYKSSTGSASDSRLQFATTFNFSNEHTATYFLFFNTTLLYVLRILASVADDHSCISSSQRIIQNILQYSEDGDHQNDDGRIITEKSAALAVCRSVPYYLGSESKASPHCSPICHWAFSTAWVALGGNDSAEGRWMMKIVQQRGNELVGRGLWAT